MGSEIRKRKAGIICASDTQAAIDRGREIARNQKSELLIHGRDGQIRKRDSHGHDPYPPKG